MKRNSYSHHISRRKFLGTTAGIAALTMMPMSFSCTGKTGRVVKSKPGLDSNFGGVQIGAITYSWRSMPGGIENIIKYCKDTGVSSIELMSGDLENYLGVPQNPMTGAARPSSGSSGPELTEEQKAGIEKYTRDLKEWRLTLPASKLAEVKGMFDRAGISIHIVKFSPSRWSDEEIDYAFKSAKALGAMGVCEEVGEEPVRKLGPVAEKHGMYAVFHNHMQFATPGFSYDPFLSASPAVMMNFDAGHFFGSTGIHPNTIIEKYHDRIFSVHLKDKTGPGTDPPNTNQVWGQGEVPIADVLKLIRDNKWPIYCDIELEYDIKPWSDAVKEVRNCVNYCRQILLCS
ncbi:MAG: sugar phosphate isomerase/epimerase [Bacteroidales bacterium]|jgi:sugar phosphate isomerase/epimerase|nr:sugar phosphate isomerase/epimerase [Bacteroidales bacterium]